MKIKKPLTYRRLMNQHLKILKGLQYKSGLFAASSKKVGTGYDKAWLRDNFYETLAFEIVNDWETMRQTHRALLDIFLKHEEKIDWAIAEKPDARHKYIHARVHPETFEEFWEEWGNKQNDAIGAILFNIGKLEKHKRVKILENENDYRIVQKLVDYLKSIEYWCDEDSGMWEEDEEVHASSVGACVAGLQMISKVKGIEVEDWLIKNGKNTLKELLPRESKRKFVDLALLSLIWPYEVVTKSQRKKILENIEYHLVKERGVIRYKNDYYYNKNTDQYSEEAEWTMGFSWLAIIYELINEKEKAKEYLEKAMNTISEKGTIPELYFSNSPKHNENNPLGWAESLFVVALFELNTKHKAGMFKEER
jgi:GH15 family glucan-1,4-alpha-glucosidase